MGAAKLSLINTLKRTLGNVIRPVYVNGETSFIFYIEKATTRVGHLSYGKINVWSYQKGGNISIGNYSSLGEINVIMGGNHHRNVSTFPFKVKLSDIDTSVDNIPIKGVSIENDCWIGQGVNILDGVNVATGTIVAAGSVVTRSTTPFSVVAGVPAKKISTLFTEEEINKLLNSKWWNIPVEKYMKIVPLLYSNDVNAFIRSIDIIRDSI